MQEDWDNSQNSYDSMFGGVKIDPGQYLARLQSAKIVEAKTSGKLMVRREHVILEGEFSGMVVFDNMQLETPMGFTFLRRWFDQMGYESPEDPAEIEDTIAAISEEAATVKISVTHSGDYINVSVIEVIEGEGSESGGESGGESESAEPEASQSYRKQRTGRKREEDRQVSEEEKKAREEQAKLANDLFAFCKAQDIETAKDDTLDVLCERIREYDWPEQELTSEEKEMFEAAGLSDRILREQPKKKAAKKKR